MPAISASSRTQFIEPPWKAILSNKGILPLLCGQAHRGHPNLLPAVFDDNGQRARPMVGPNYVRKPIFSREGWDVELSEGERESAPVQRGGYGEEGHIVQRYAPLGRFDGQFAVIGSWIVGDAAVGMSVREDHGPITRDLARFVPHVILEEGDSLD